MVRNKCKHLKSVMRAVFRSLSLSLSLNELSVQSTWVHVLDQHLAVHTTQLAPLNNFPNVFISL